MSTAHTPAWRYYGSFERSIDPKGRLVIPAEWRPEGEGERTLIVMASAEAGTVKVFPKSWMRRVEERYAALPSTSPERQQIDKLIARAQLMEWDDQGRVNLKKDLLKRASISSDVMLVGAGDHFKIVDGPVYTEQEAAAASTITVEGLGL